MQLYTRPLALRIMHKGNIVIKDHPKWITFFVIKYAHMFGCFKWVPSLYISIVLATESCLFSYISWSHLSPVTLKMYGLHGCGVGGQKQTLFTQWKKADCEHRKSAVASEVHSKQTGNASQCCLIFSLSGPFGDCSRLSAIFLCLCVELRWRHADLWEFAD